MNDRGYQIEAQMKAIRFDGFCLFLDLGTGKTKTSLDIARRRYQRQQAQRFLIVGPIRVKGEWVKQIERWWPELTILNNFQDACDGPCCYITHYEFARTRYKLLRKAKFDMIIADEGHKMRRRTSQQSRRLHLLARDIKYRLLLTGTPVEHDDLDYWPYFRFIDESVFGASWTDFADGPVKSGKGKFASRNLYKAWCVRSGFQGTKRKLRQDKRQAFLDLVHRYSYTIRKEDAIDLPPITMHEVPITMTGKQRTAYIQMERDFVVKLPGITQISELVITQMLRLQQIAGGFIKDIEGVTHKLGSAKLDYIEDHLESYHQPIVIFARFLAEVDAITKLALMHDRRVHKIVGGIKHVRDEDFDVAVVQSGVTAGLDYLKSASLGIFYSKTFSRLEFEQARDRLHRDGQKNPVMVVSLISISSIDEDIEHALAMKGDTITEVFNQLKHRQNIMAKAAPAKTAKATPAPAPAPAKETKASPKFGIAELAAELEKEQPLIRVLLRKLEIEKNGGRYGWDTQKEFDAVVKQLSDASKKEAKEKAEKTEKPAPAAKATKKAA